MTINQEQLIKEVAKAEGADVATVRDVIDTMGNIIFDYLSSAAPSEDVSIKIWPGIVLHSEFIPAHTMEYGIQEGIPCPDKIRVHARFSRRFKDKLNKKEDEDKQEGD